MTTYLLDVNVLLALFDPNHVTHRQAHQWFQEMGRRSWATCPILENGFIRIASHPNYPACPGSSAEVREYLRQFCRVKEHQFWSDSVTLLNDNLFPKEANASHGQVTDIYLLGLAVRQKGKLATFDRHIPAATVHNGAASLEIIAV